MDIRFDTGVKFDAEHHVSKLIFDILNKSKLNIQIYLKTLKNYIKLCFEGLRLCQNVFSKRNAAYFMSQSPSWYQGNIS